MNTTPCDSAGTMYHLTTGHQRNASCNCSLPPTNWSSGGDTLQLPTFTTAAKARVVITFILCGISAFCNLAVLWAAHSDGKRKSHVRVLIINLTVADLLVTFIVMPVDAVWNITVQWLAGDFACRLLMFLKLQAMYSCAFVTVVISLDRQSAILNPLAINKARKRNRVMLSVAWGMSIILSVPQVRSGIRIYLYLTCLKHVKDLLHLYRDTQGHSQEYRTTNYIIIIIFTTNPTNRQKSNNEFIQPTSSV